MYAIISKVDISFRPKNYDEQRLLLIQVVS